MPVSQPLASDSATVAGEVAACGHNGGVNESPRRGRPRTEGADEAILTATLELAGEVGFGGMSMDVVAERAGVSKATIYRRWSSKEALVLAALRSAIGPLDDVDLGSVRADLEAYLGDLSERMNSGKMSDLLPHLIEVSVGDPQVRCSLDDYVAFRRRPLIDILERGVARGELRADAEVTVLVDALIGPIIYRKLLTRAELSTEFAQFLIDLVLTSVER
jgi:AcrR family transcriptional regulator